LSTKIELQTKVVKWSDCSNYHTHLSSFARVWLYGSSFRRHDLGVMGTLQA
jgi:hypothetical protein